MVGFCGIVSEFDHNLDSVTETIVWSDREHDSRYTDNGIDLYVSMHRSEEAKAQPATIGEGRQLCIWGDVLGFEGSHGYKPRDREQTTDADYCATLCEEHGLSFIDGLNSEFAGLVFDGSNDKLTLFTDRLSARPVFYTESIDGAILFSTHPKTILTHPEVEPTIDEELLVEFLTFERVFGTKTPFEEVIQLHPGSRLTYDLENDSTSRTIYWRPEYDPADKSYDEFVEEFASLYRQAVEERRKESVEEGVLISGGSDSRLLLSMLDTDDVTGYHMNEHMNAEAEAANKVCKLRNVEFQLLERREDYQRTVLERVSELQLFTSFFDQAHATGFEARLVNDLDSVFCAQYSDTILQGHYVPSRNISLPLIDWTIPLPVSNQINKIRQYIKYCITDHNFGRQDSPRTIPSYINLSSDLQSILSRRFSHTDKGIQHHGVVYPSYESLRFTGGYFPLTNAPTYLNYYTLVQMLPTRYPFLDNRIIDFSLSMPQRYHHRKNIVNSALSDHDPELAEIPHPGTGLPLSRPKRTHILAELKDAFVDKIRTHDSDVHAGPWSDHNRVLRESDIVSKHLINGDQKLCWNEIDPAQVREIYKQQLDGESHYFDLYGLLSLCNSYPFSEIRNES